LFSGLVLKREQPGQGTILPLLAFRLNIFMLCSIAQSLFCCF